MTFNNLLLLFRSKMSTKSLIHWEGDSFGYSHFPHGWYTSGPHNLETRLILVRTLQRFLSVAAVSKAGRYRGQGALLVTERAEQDLQRGQNLPGHSPTTCLPLIARTHFLTVSQLWAPWSNHFPQPPSMSTGVSLGHLIINSYGWHIPCATCIVQARSTDRGFGKDGPRLTVGLF